jgi:signal peptidase I
VRRFLKYGAIGLGLLVGALVSLTIFGAILLLATGTVKTYRAVSTSMTPALECARPAPGCESDASDRFSVLTRFRSFDRADIVVFQTPSRARAECGAGGTFVQRIIGLPGEAVQIRLRGGAAYVYIDGVELEEPYIEQDRRDIGPEKRFRVPEGHYFVMGDNRARTCDSRVYGSVPVDDVVGEVTLTYWPPSRISFR